MNSVITSIRLLGVLGFLLLGALLSSALADHISVEHEFSLSALPLASGHSVPVEQRIGLGFAISQRNGGSHVITAAHVVNGCEVIGVTYADSLRRQATLIGLDDNNDLALLFVQGEAPGFARFKAQGQPSGNNRIFRGSHDSFGIASADGETIGYRGAQLDTRLMSFHGQAVKPGESGGPVFDKEGHVIGMIIGHVPDMEVGSNSLRQISYALKVPILLAFLSAFDNPQTVEPLQGPLEDVDLHNLVAKTTADVTCIAATRTNASTASNLLSDG
ncbi:MAG: serine protease [Alphaproteobacteria bacterium]